MTEPMTEKSIPVSAGGWVGVVPADHYPVYIHLAGDSLFIRSSGGPDYDEWKSGRPYGDDFTFWVEVKRFRLADASITTVFSWRQPTGDAFSETCDDWIGVLATVITMTDAELLALSPGEGD